MAVRISMYSVLWMRVWCFVAKAAKKLLGWIPGVKIEIEEG